MQSVIDYRPSHGGGLDYHNSPLIGDPATDLYHMHRSIDQLRSLNERGTLNNIASMNNSDLKSSSSSTSSSNSQAIAAAAALQLEYKLYNNNNSHEQNHQSHHQSSQQHHHSNIEYLKSDVGALIDEQGDKIESVLKQVEKHEIDSAYNASSMSPSSTPPPTVALTDGRGRKKGSKKVSHTYPTLTRIFLSRSSNVCQLLPEQIVDARSRSPSPQFFSSLRSFMLFAACRFAIESENMCFAHIN